MPIYALRDEFVFPDPALAEPDGVLAIGGGLEPERIVLAYSQGIFPWPMSDGFLTWFSPDPRMLLTWDALRVSRSLRRSFRRSTFCLTMDEAFTEVVECCASAPRHGQSGTWITKSMRDAYEELHRLGFAHSVEVWDGDELVGGLYGISLGGMFCGESMFHRRRDASKIAFVALARQLAVWEFAFLDCQIHTEHLERLGAREVPRDEFLQMLDRALQHPTRGGRWCFEEGAVVAEP